jgi:hypothetical protein
MEGDCKNFFEKITGKIPSENRRKNQTEKMNKENGENLRK